MSRSARSRRNSGARDVVGVVQRAHFPAELDEPLGPVAGEHSFRLAPELGFEVCVRHGTLEASDGVLDVLLERRSLRKRHRNVRFFLPHGWMIHRRRDAVAEMKAEGLDYDQRMEELEKLEYPKPLREFVYQTFNAFADRHPWVEEENIRPKSIAREMCESFFSFADYVQEYDLERAEGLLLPHLNSVYKVLRQTVPDGVKADEFVEMELYQRDMLRQVDSSLLEEWERMRDPDYKPWAREEPGPSFPEEAPDVTRDTKAFTAAIRTRVFAFLRAWSIGDDEAALRAIDSEVDADGGLWSPERLRAAREAFRVDHAGLRLDPEARNLRHTHVKPADDRTTWRVEQMLVDLEDLNDWVAEIEVDLAGSREAGEPMIQLLRLETLV